MNSDRREQIESVCAEALSKVGPDRVAFLDAAERRRLTVQQGTRTLAESALNSLLYQARIAK